jgi:hypothetical protein
LNARLLGRRGDDARRVGGATDEALIEGRTTVLRELAHVGIDAVWVALR